MSENDKPADETQPVRPQDPHPGSGAADHAAGPAAGPAGDPAGAQVADPGAAHPASGPAPGPAPAPAAAYGAPVERRGLRERLRRARTADRDRAFSLGALIASALAGVIVGGVGTAVFHAVTDDHDRVGWVERRGPVGRGDFDDDDRGPMFGGPRGVPGQLQPTTPPEEDDSGTSS